MPLLTQSRFPAGWRLFQYWLGGTVDKRHLCLLKYQGQRHILEVGCSVGNIAQGFVRRTGVEYTGIDIDPVVIEYARKTFVRHSNAVFLCGDLADLSLDGRSFQYVLLAGLCHHIDDAACRRVFAAARPLMAEGGMLVVVDPLLPRHQDGWFLRQYMRLEQGEYVRSGPDMHALISGAPGFRIREAEEHLVAATPAHWPKCARFGLYTLEVDTSGDLGGGRSGGR